MASRNIRKNDTVIVTAGASVGKTGKVLQVLPDRDRAIVEGLNLVKKALRKSEDNPQGGIAEKEVPIHISNLMLYCDTCKRGVRIERSGGKGAKVRKCRRCGETLDS
jgi:large subunit ribosomal protein L24